MKITKDLTKTELETLLETLTANPVLWDDVETGKIEKKVYNQWHYRKARIEKFLISIETQEWMQEREERQRKMFEETRNPVIQELADALHDATCTLDHEEKCWYDAWNDDFVRYENHRYYMKVVGMLEKESLSTVQSLLSTVELGESAKKTLENFN